MVDYSKWNNIDVSEDEDDYHPNVDQASLWKWKKEARVLNEQREAEQKKKIKEDHEKTLQRLKVVETLAVDGKALPDNVVDELKKQEAEYAAKEAEIERMERLYPKWTSSNICHDAFSKTIIEKEKDQQGGELSEDQKFEEQAKFYKAHKKEIMHFGLLKTDDASEAYLNAHPYLVNESTANYLVVRAVDYEVEKKHDEMRTVARQTILMQFMLEIAKTAKQPPPVIIKSYFRKIKAKEEEYARGFQDELQGLISRVQERAKVRIEEAIKEYEEEEREKRIAASPGGLDPEEVMETLPEAMRTAFTARDIGMLQEALKTMDLETAKYHIDRCAKSGLWVPSSDDD